jgi:hypothetical protein
MNNLETRVDVGGNYSLYEVTVVDTNPSAEANAYVFKISGNVGNLSDEVVESGIAAFSESLASSNPTFQVGTIKKTVVTETTL